MTVPGHTSGAPALAPVSTGSISVAAPPAISGRRRFAGRPVLRRVIFVGGYETLSVIFTLVVLNGLLGHGGSESALTAVLVSTAATIWNYVWNIAFEAIERRTGHTNRGVLSRAIHAVGYEGGVLVVTIPLVAVMLGVGFFEAMLIESSLLVFFLVFTVVYTWAFDRVFGLPEAR